MKIQYEEDRKEKKKRDEMDRQVREARAAMLAAGVTTSRDGKQHNQGAAGAAPDGDEPMSVLPVHEGEQTEDLGGRSPSPEAPAGANDNAPTSTNQPDTPPQVTLRFA